MGKQSGGTRKTGPNKSASNTIVGIKESDKAIMLTAHVEVNVSPEGGYTSSQSQQKIGSVDVWIPKSQIKDGMVSEWIAMQKLNEIKAKMLSKSVNYKDNGSTIFFTDKNGKAVQHDNSQTEAKLSKGISKHDALLAEAKSLGIKGVSVTMKSATLQQKINDQKAGIAKVKTASSFTKSSTKVSVGSTVQGKFGTGKITKIITASSGYVEVTYPNGKKSKEMAFNLKGEDGLFLKKKPNS